MNYVISDHLGSIWALANENGGFNEQYAYDAWGKRVNPTNWAQADTRTTFKTDRGFTLHEHYDHMQIINMVARMYDPIMGQFISVDPLYAKYPGISAYVYCMNNPIEYWDPTGEEVVVDFSGIEDDEVRAAVEEEFLNELSEATGQIYEIGEGGVLSVDEDATAAALESGELGKVSKEGREFLNGLIESNDIMTINGFKDNTTETANPKGTNTINLNFNQIDNRKEKVNELGLKNGVTNAGKSVNGAMSFFHEAYHSKMGGQLPDPIGGENPRKKSHTVGKVNKIRRQLDFQERGYKMKGGVWAPYVGGGGTIPMRRWGFTN